MELYLKSVNKFFKKSAKRKKLKFFSTKENQNLHHVLRNLNLEVHDNEIFCLLGNNGAGKSTLLNCVGGIHVPESGLLVLRTGGEIIDIVKESKKAKRKIIFNFQDPKFDTRMSLKSNLDFHLRIYMIERETRHKLIDEYLSLFNLQSKKNSKFYFLSGGQKKQLENIRGFTTSKAFQSNDRLFLTDEPTAYCDVSAKKLIWEELASICEQGESTVLFSTNDLVEAEKLIKPSNGKIGFIRDGSIAFSGSLHDLQSKLTSKGNLNLLSDSQIDGEAFDSFKNLISKQYESISVSSLEDSHGINIENINQEQINMVISEAITYFQSQNIFLDKIEKVKPTINDLFIKNGV